MLHNMERTSFNLPAQYTMYVAQYGKDFLQFTCAIYNVCCTIWKGLPSIYLHNIQCMLHNMERTSFNLPAQYTMYVAQYFTLYIANPKSGPRIINSFILNIYSINFTLTEITVHVKSKRSTVNSAVYTMRVKYSGPQIELFRSCVSRHKMTCPHHIR